MPQSIENNKKGLRVAIIILSVILMLIILFFCYQIFYPSISKIFGAEVSPELSKNVAGEVKDNEENFIRELSGPLIELTNKEREKAGLKPLKENEKLIKVADFKAMDLFKYNYWGHESPKYGKIDNQFLQFGGIRMGIDATAIGENLAKFTGYDKEAIKPEEIMEAWMNSPAHKENILKEDYNSIGISAYYTNDKTCFIAQEFMLAS